MILSCSLSYGQLTISIDSVVLEGVVEVKDSKEHISHFGYGPKVVMFIAITNKSFNTLVVSSNRDYSLYCEYMYDGKWHRSLEMFLFLVEGKPLSLALNETYRAEVSTCLFAPYDVVEAGDLTIYDHLPKLKEVLSTFRLVFYFDNKRYETGGIPQIKIGNGLISDYK